MTAISEDRLDLLEEAVRAKVDTMTGFADVEGKERSLEKVFKYFDTNSSGTIDFNEFFAAMTRLNFVGVQRELECLFDRYDEDCSNTLDYKEFSKHLFGMGRHLSMNATSRSVVERVKARILELGGANGIRSLTYLMRRMDTNGSNTLERSELCEGLCSFGLADLDEAPGGDLDKLMSYFDRDKNDRISIEELHRGIRGHMSKRRAVLVKEAFSRLDKTGDGTVTVEDLRQCYNTASHPDVASGRISEAEALEETLSIYEQGPTADGVVTWHEFLEYYKDLSAGVEDDDYFELMMRNAWRISGGEGAAANSACRRVMVAHSDGTQEVVEIKDDLGVAAGDLAEMRKRLEAQGVQDIANLSLYD